MSQTLWLRAETKPFEQRTPLTPSGALELLKLEVKVVVEKDQNRIFDIAEYKKVGCSIVDSGSWKEAPENSIILGLKELPETNDPISNTHIYFSHTYKGQTGAQEVLCRFKNGGGKILDLEYIVDEEGRRPFAFGYWAGYMGAALAVDIFAHKKLNTTDYSRANSYSNKESLVSHLRERVSAAGVVPAPIIIGAKGKSGNGAAELFRSIGIKNAALWDYEETKTGGPFGEILEHDIFVNCVFINQKIPPFLTNDLLENNNKLSVISDVSCDPNGPYNPIPVYDQITTCDAPVVKIKGGVDLCAIDHLPSLLPRESSEDYAGNLLPYLKDLVVTGDSKGVWKRCEGFFNQMFL